MDILLLIFSDSSWIIVAITLGMTLAMAKYFRKEAIVISSSGRD